MLNNLNQSSFAFKVPADNQAFPIAPSAAPSPKATGLIRDNWTFKPHEPQPTLVIPSAPAPQSNWFDKLLGFASMVLPGAREGVAFWKAVPPVVQDAAEIGQGLWGVAQNAWNTMASWFSPPAAPAVPAAPEAPAPNTHVWVPFPAEPASETKPEPSDDQLAEQERQIRRRTRVVLKRDATEAEVAEYQKRLAAGATMSDVHEALQNLPEAQIARIFQDEVGQDIDDRGRAFWMNEYNQGEELEDIRSRIRVIVGKSKSV